MSIPTTHDEWLSFIDRIPASSVHHPLIGTCKQLGVVEQNKAHAACFERDRMDIWEGFRLPQTSAMKYIAWAKENQYKVVQSNPLLIAQWGNAKNESSLALLALLFEGVDALGHASDAARLALLRGEPCADAPAIGHWVCTLLTKYPMAWSLASPAWIGQEHSELRKHAMATGWAPSMLPMMCVRAVKRGGHYGSFGYVRTPNSLAILLEALVQWRADASWISRPTEAIPRKSLTTLRFYGSTDAYDCSMARLLMQVLPPLPYSMETSAGAPQLDDDGERHLRDTVQTYLSLGMLEELVAHVVQQNLMEHPDQLFEVRQRGQQEALVLPELGDACQ